MSYELKIPEDKFEKNMKLKIFIERLGSKFPCKYKISVNGTQIAQCTRSKNLGDKFMFESFNIPKETVENSEGKFIVKFETIEGEIEPIFRLGITN